MIPVDLVGLIDVLELIRRIKRQIGPLDYAAFEADIDVQDTTAYRLLHIGETVRTFPGDLRARHPDIPWAAIIGTRNILAHEYYMRESDTIWETLTDDLDALADVCRAEIVAAGFDPDLRRGDHG